MRASDFTLQQRRERLRAIFAHPRDRRLHELIDMAVTASSTDEPAEEEPARFDFPASRRERVAV